MYGPQLPKTGMFMLLGTASLYALYGKIFLVFFILTLVLIVFSYARLRYHERKMRKKNVL